MTIKHIVGLWLLLLYGMLSRAQDQPGVTDKVLNLPSKFFSRINQQAAGLDKNLTKQTEKYLDRLAKREARLRKKLYAKDSAAAKKLFDQPPLDYKAMAVRLQQAGTGGLPVKSPSGAYSPYLDSMVTSLKFLQQHGSALPQTGVYQAQITSSLSQLNTLQARMQVTEQIRQQIRQRQARLKAAFSQLTDLSGLKGAYQGYSQQAYYLGQQMKQYRDELNDPDKLTKRALSVLSQLPTFQQFMKSNSQLASLFALPSGGSGGGLLPGLGSSGGTSASTAQALAGLQTRSNIQSLLQSQVAAGGPNAQQMVQQNIQSAQAQLQTWKNKVSQAGGGGSDADLPDFKPNPMHTKTFLQRLEYGANIQSAKSTYGFPTTTDFAVTAGYRLNDRNTVGLGGSYRLGWGKDISHIKLSGNGIGLRSYLEMKIKGSLYATGGYELNYQPVGTSLAVAGWKDWTRSGLAGVEKKYTINKKLKGNLQLLWDFLSYSQLPKTAPLKFRVGYNF